MKKTMCALLGLITLTTFAVSTIYAKDLKMTGWPYKPDTVTENLGVFKTQSGISSKFLPIPSDSYHDKMVSDFATGTDFDVVYVRDNFLAEWASAGWLHPIQNMPGFGQYRKDLSQASIDQLSVDGNVYGLPYYAGMMAFAYNADHLKKAGISAPPKTWGELLEQAKKVKAAGISNKPITLQLKKGNYIIITLEVIAAGFGGTMFDSKHNPTFQKAGSAFWSAMEWTRKGLKAGLIDEASLSSGDHDVVNMLSAGSHTFTIVADYNLKSMNDPEKSKNAGKFKNALIPGNGKTRSGTTSYVRLYSITADSKDKAASWKLLQFLGGRDANNEYFVAKKWALNDGLGFAQLPLYDDPDIRNSLGKWTNPDVMAEQSKYSVNRGYRFLPHFSDWQTETWAELQEMLMGDDYLGGDLEKLAAAWEDLRG
jgi:multiple sugar transport system substrate-binding protein